MAGQAYRTLSEVLSDASNRPSGFDYMRLILSVGVLVSHSVLYNYGDPAGFEFWDSPARPFLKWLVPMFFALSGFLVAGSLDRSKSAISYMGLRAIRIYFYRNWVPHNLPLFIVSAVLSVVFLGYVKGGEYIAVLPTAYVTVYLGTLNPKRSGVSAMGDYSYAIYLWGGVIQQTVVFAFPELREWYWNLLFATPICLLVSYLSWVLIERPAMALRRPLAAIEAVLLGVYAQAQKRAVAWFQVKTGTVQD